MQTVGDFGIFSSTWDTFINPPPQKAQETLWRRRQKVCKSRAMEDSKETRSSKHSRQTHELTETEAECTQHAQVHPRWDFNTVSGKWIQVRIPNQEAISNRQLLAKGNFIFSNGISLGIQTMLKRRWLTQDKFKGSDCCCCYIIL